MAFPCILMPFYPNSGLFYCSCKIQDLSKLSNTSEEAKHVRNFKTINVTSREMSKTPKVLVVDDDFDCRTMVKTILESSGYEAIDAESGPKALDILESQTVDLIVLDIMMPEMTGYEVVVRLKEKTETQNIPVVMLTAKGDPEDLITGYKDYGVDYYITKPFTTRQLLAGIKLILSGEDEEEDFLSQ